MVLLTINLFRLTSVFEHICAFDPYGFKILKLVSSIYMLPNELLYISNVEFSFPYESDKYSFEKFI